ncbi:MAG: thiamine pyrophosphate-binding protein [Acidobacteriota bacterium]|nr:thiamine pyrophosphate-binding protein [Acidobacteriota bacterium]
MSSVHSQPAAVVEHARTCLEQLGALGYDFFTGVPCSLLNPLYAALGNGDLAYYPATREDLAVGLAAGATMAGRRPVVLMQNSGLGVSINALLSLQRMYELPVLLIVSWRGHGPDAPEHVDLGARMPALFETLGVRWRFLSAGDAFDPAFHDEGDLAALVVRPKEFERRESEEEGSP